MPPKIDREGLRDIKIKAGQPIDLDINVSGEPPPKIEWRLNDEPLQSSDRTKIDNSREYNTKLKTFDTCRIDSGVYKIIATNASGKDVAEFTVTVLGKRRKSDLSFYLKICIVL